MAEFRRLAVHFPLLDARVRSVALLVAQGYDAGAIAGDLQIKRFDVYQLLEVATAQLRRADADRPAAAPVLPPLQRPRDFSPILPIYAHDHREEPEIVEDSPPISTQNIPPGRTSDEDEKEEVSRPKVGRGRGVRHCRRCGQPGHNVNGCDLDESDLAAARVQDIAAACARLRLTPPPAPPVIPVRMDVPAPAASLLPTWDREDLDAIAAMVPDLPEPPAPAVPPPPAAPERVPNVSDLHERHRAATIRSPYRLTMLERRAGEELQAPDDIEMPRTREECQKDPGRPCPWVRCKAHLFLDVNEQTGAIKLNFPHLEVWEMRETCSNDVADRGEHTLEQVGTLMNLTRERVRQIEMRASENQRAKKIAEDIEFTEHDDGSPLATAIG